MRKTKKFISGFLAFAMLASVLAGCTTDSGPGPDGPIKADDPALNDTNKEFAKIIYKNYSGAGSQDNTFKDTVVGKIMKEQINVEFEQLPSSSNDTDMIQDFAAAQMPDFFTAWATPSNFKQLDQCNKAAREGVLADFAPYINSSFNNYPTLKGIFDSKLPAFMDSVCKNPEFGDKRYFLPSTYTMSDKPWLSGWGFYIRGDIAKSLNVKTPNDFKSQDEFYNLLKNIKSKNFKDINGKTIIPLGAVQSWNQVMSAISRPYDFGGATQIDVLNGKLTHLVETRYIEDQITWVRKLVTEGLLDPELFTQKTEQGTEKMAQGRYGIMPNFAINAMPDRSYQLSLASINKDMPYQPLGNMPNYNGENTLTVNRGMEASQILAISKRAPVKGVLRFLEWVNTNEGRITVALGREGVEWDYNKEGYAQMRKDVYEKYKSKDTQWVNSMGVGKLDWFSKLVGDGNPDYNVFGGDGKDPTYQTDPVLQNILNDLVNKMMPNVKVVDALNVNVLLQKYPKKEAIQPPLNLFEETLKKCYLSKTDAEAKKILDSYRKEIKNGGLDAYIKYLQDEYNKDKSKYVTYVSDVQ